MNNMFYTWRQSVIRSSLPPTTRHLLLTLGCHMNDMGESCYPSIELLCEETGLSNRSVITHLKIAVSSGFISCEKHGFSGQRWARNEYKATFPPLNLGDENTLKAVKEVHDLKPKAVNLVHQGSEPNDVKAVKEVHTNYTVNYTYNKTTPCAREKEIKVLTPQGDLACRLLPLNILVTSINPILIKWVEDKIPIDLILQCINLARQNKPWPEKIPAAYLDKVIRSEMKPKIDNTWAMTHEGIDKKSKELGVRPKPDETYDQFRERLKVIIQQRQHVAV